LVPVLPQNRLCKTVGIIINMWTPFTICGAIFLELPTERLRSQNVIDLGACLELSIFIFDSRQNIGDAALSCMFRLLAGAVIRGLVFSFFWLLIASSH